MRINNNLMAMNTHRQLGIAQGRGANSMEKLSSGFRINRAGDDAAGLAISEKMRGQIRGLNQASRNAQDGISMIQTAEGALNETHSILQRMRELAVQSANDTNVEIDRDEIQKEINQLSSEINRIGNTTEFNTMSLLKGMDAHLVGDVEYGTTDLQNLALVEGTQLTSGDYQIDILEDGKINDTVVAGSSYIGSGTGYLEANTVNADNNVLEGYTIRFVQDATSDWENNAENEIDIDKTNKTITVNANWAGDQTSDAVPTNVAAIETAMDTALAAAFDDFSSGDLVLNESGTYDSTEFAGRTISLEQSTVIGNGDFSVDDVQVDPFSALDAGEYNILIDFDSDVENLQAGDTGITAIDYTGDNPNVIGNGLEVEMVYAGNGADDVYNIFVRDADGTLLASELGHTVVTGTVSVGDFDIDTTAPDSNDDRVGTATFDITGDGWRAQVVNNTGAANSVAGAEAVDINAGDQDVDLGFGITANFNNTLEDGDTGTFHVNEDVVGLLGEQGTALNDFMESLHMPTPSPDVNTTHTFEEYGVSVDSPVNTPINAGTVKFSVNDEFNADLQVGANFAQSMTVNFSDMRSQALDITGDGSDFTAIANDGAEASFVEIATVTDGTDNTAVEYALDVSSHDKATAAVSVINDAIEHVSAERSKLGAFQNRLEHTISNLDNSAENLQAAESRIRDVDMAAEMMELTKQNILQQASTAMLAQANQAPQSVLQLLG